MNPAIYRDQQNNIQTGVLCSTVLEGLSAFKSQPGSQLTIRTLSCCGAVAIASLPNKAHWAGEAGDCSSAIFPNPKYKILHVFLYKHHLLGWSNHHLPPTGSIFSTSWTASLPWPPRLQTLRPLRLPGARAQVRATKPRKL